VWRAAAAPIFTKVSDDPAKFAQAAPAEIALGHLITPGQNREILIYSIV